MTDSDVKKTAPACPRRRKRAQLAGLAILAGLVLAACTLTQPANVASGMTSHIVCSGVFVSGLDPKDVFNDVMKPQEGYSTIAPLVSYEVDRTHKEVTTHIAGMFGSRAVYRDGWGCVLDRGGLDALPPYPADMAEASKAALPALPAIAGDAIVEPETPELKLALDHAFADPDEKTKAVVVLHDGRIVAERYAPGYGPRTRLHGWSTTKSVINALVGIMAREGKMALHDNGLLPQWRDASDPRHAITVEELLRQTSGLDVEQTNTGFDPSSRMKFVESDYTAFAAKASIKTAPGSTWAYSDANYVILGRLLRDKAGGSGADLMRFAQRELFEPLGMTDVTLEVDASGSPIGSAFMYASARDWARFGQLYLNDGMAGTTRILPPGWARFSSSQTLATGYGAGFFINRVKGGEISNWGIGWELPRAPEDIYFARGYMGQYVIVAPDEHLVVVRMGPSLIWGGSIESAGALVAEAAAALHEPRVSKP